MPLFLHMLKACFLMFMIPLPSYFRGGVLSAFCRAGYWCLSGAKSDIPVTTTIFENCLPGDECAGMCPTGHYCENGTLIPTPCPELTYRNETGGQQLSDCAICPAGYICLNGKKSFVCPISTFIFSPSLTRRAQ